MLDAGTGFQCRGFLGGMDARTAWRMSRKHCIDVYARAPDYVHTDAGTNFNSVVFWEQATAMGIIVRITPAERKHQMGIAEHSHGCLRPVYYKCCIDSP